MQGKILIVDAIVTNRIVLKVKLASAYYQVLQASTIAEATAIAQTQAPDLIISALTFPDCGAAELSTQLLSNPLTRLIPVLAIGGCHSPKTRITALKAGVQDVLTKPVDDTLLLGRVRSLIRAHNATAEWRVRDDTSRALGLAEPQPIFTPAGHCMMISDESGRAQSWMMQLRPLLRAKLSLKTASDLLRVMENATLPDVYVLILPQEPARASVTMRLISTLRANASTCYAGIVVIQTTPDSALAADVLDLGADDIMTDGFEAVEMTLRLKALLKRKQFDACLRASFRTGLEEAMLDPLTRLHNRRYAMPYLHQVAQHARNNGGHFALMVADLDHFKQINDIYGHASGDAVLVEVATRLRTAVRAEDLIARIGGEEFLIVMPGTTVEEARSAATRICRDIGDTPFRVPGHRDPVEVTVSIGMTVSDGQVAHRTVSDDTETVLLDQADKALYCAKVRGRNRVTLGRPAA